VTGPRAVLLDALGTLVHLEPPAPLLQAQLAARGADVTETQAASALRAEIRYYREHHDEAVDAQALSELRDRCTEVLRAALPEPARGVEDLRGALLASLRFTPYAEVLGVLAALRARGARLVVVSNWDVSLHEMLTTTGLGAHVDGAITSAEVGAAKPAPEIFAAALGIAGVPAADAVHAGDTVAADVEGARRAGLVPVFVDRAGTGPSVPDGTVVLSDLRGLLGPPVYRPGDA
jgi:putative hydrolase of the HAD superfamily